MNNSHKPLKIGLLIDSFQIPAWAYRVVEKVCQDGFAQFSLVILHPAAQTSANWGIKAPHNFGSLLYRAFEKFEDQRYNPLNPFALTDVKPLLTRATVMTLNPPGSKFTFSFQEEEIEQIRRHRLDIIFKVGTAPLSGEILRAARHGVWAYHHSANPADSAEPFGFWEVLEQHPTTGVQLLILGERTSQHRVIYHSDSSTNEYSFKRNRSLHYWKSVSFLPRRLRDLSELGEEPFFAMLDQMPPPAPPISRKPFPPPSNRRLLLPLARHMLRQGLDKLRKRKNFHQWILLYHLGENDPRDFRTYRKILPPKDRLWADPFVRYRDGAYYIFIEEALYNPKRGVISVITMDEQGNYGAPQTIIERPYHMSYPYLIHWEGEDYMIPETSQNQTIELYKCVEFPYKWAFQYNLMEGVKAVDTTLFPHDGKWWMFVNITENEGASTWDELFLFYADHPFSRRWTPHPQNPVVSDTKSARPAGKIFLQDGKIYRPSQNCARRYGYGLKLNRIIELNEQRYREEESASHEPWEERIKGVHTYNRDHHLTLIDAVYWRQR